MVIRFALPVLAFFLGVFAQVLSAQAPQINVGGVVNAASYAQPAVLAPGAIFSVFGSFLTDGSSALAPATPLPNHLAGTRLLVNGVAAPLFFASPPQINAQFPVELSELSNATVQVEVQLATGTITSSVVNVLVSPFSLGIFTLDQTGSGPGAILLASNSTQLCPYFRRDCAPNYVISGETISIYMTGLGQVAGPWLSGQAAVGASPTLSIPIVTIGGIQARVLFAGLAPNFVGLYQLNVVVPSNAMVGDAIPLVVSIGEAASNQVTLSVGSGR